MNEYVGRWTRNAQGGGRHFHCASASGSADGKGCVPDSRAGNAVRGNVQDRSIVGRVGESQIQSGADVILGCGGKSEGAPYLNRRADPRGEIDASGESGCSGGAVAATSVESDDRNDCQRQPQTA